MAEQNKNRNKTYSRLIKLNILDGGSSGWDDMYKNDDNPVKNTNISDKNDNKEQQ